MACMDMTIKWQRRRAKVTLNTQAAAYNKMEEGVHDCHVLGLFQYSNGDDEVCPYFICEMNDGRNIYAAPEHVRFVDTNENGDIIKC